MTDFEEIQRILLQKANPLKIIGFSVNTEIRKIDSGEPYTVKLAVEYDAGEYVDYFDSIAEASNLNPEAIFDEWMEDYRYETQEQCYRNYF